MSTIKQAISRQKLPCKPKNVLKIECEINLLNSYQTKVQLSQNIFTRAYLAQKSGVSGTQSFIEADAAPLIDTNRFIIQVLHYKCEREGFSFFKVLIIISGFLKNSKLINDS